MGALFRTDVRRRWRGLAVLALILGLSGSVVLGAFAGARRTSTAFERFGATTHIADAQVAITDFALGCQDPNAGEVDHVAYSRANAATLRALPSVEAAAVYRTLAVRPAGSDAVPFQDLIGHTYVDAASVDDVDRWIVHDGRPARAGQPDEAVVNRTAARELGLAVGDEVTLESVADDVVIGCGPAGGDPAPDGPSPTIRVVGIGTMRDELVSGADASSVLALTPAFLDRWGNDIAGYERAVVQLRDGPGGVDELEADLTEAYGEGTLNFVVIPQDQLGTRQVEDAVSLQAVTLVVFGTIAAAAAAVVVGQGLARQLDRPHPDRTALRACGCSPRSTILAASLVGAVVGLAGGLAAVIGGAVASVGLPFGLAGRAEPDPGLDVDPAVLVGGAVVIAVAAAAFAAAHEALAARADRRTAELPPARPSRPVHWLARSGVPVEVTMGARFALLPGRGAAAVPVRSALLGTLVAVAGVTAAVVFGANLQHLLDRPALYGQPFDLDVGVGTDPAVVDDVVDRVRSEDAVRDVAVADVLKDVQLDDLSTQGYGLTDRVGHIEPTVLEGRAPSSAREILLAPDTRDDLGVEIGDTVTALGGTPEPSDYRVVGVGLVPTLDSDRYTEGFIVTGAGVDRLHFPITFGDVVATTPGAAPTPVQERLADDGFVPMGGSPPAEIDNLHDVDQLPRWLVAFLSVLGAAAIGHGLVMTVRRRRRDLGVLRALGFRRGQTGRCVLAQAWTIAAIGLIVGVVIGLAIGRSTWSLQADRLHVAPTIEVPVVGIAIVVAATLVVSALAAVWPGRRAGRVQPAVLLRDD